MKRWWWFLGLVQTVSALLRASAATLPQNVLDALQHLEGAVQRGDIELVESLTQLVTQEAKRRSAATAPSALQEENASSAVAVHSHSVAPLDKVADVAAQGHNAAKLGKALHLASEANAPTCLLDDYIFAISHEDKQTLAQELNTPEMLEALQWVKHGGWWTCATYGEQCTCHGNVRMVDVARTKQAKLTIAGAAPWYNVYCDISSFGNEDIFPGGAKRCECEHTQSKFHLHKRLTSKSALQEAWIFLLRFLGRTKLLPAGTGDRLYHGVENWAARGPSDKMPMVLERVWIDMYINKVVSKSTTGARCLEWGDPSSPGKGFNYANLVPSCTYKMDVQYDAVHWGHKPLGLEGNILYSDIDNMPKILQHGGDHRVDVIFATQVFEHLHNPSQAVHYLFESLLPGGTLVFTAPEQAQFHLVPHDFFRYTKEGVLYLLQQAGFCVPAWAFAGGGDFIFDMARDAGLQVQDFPMEEIEGAFQEHYNMVSDSAITIHTMGFKPPHPYCQHAMAPLNPGAHGKVFNGR